MDSNRIKNVALGARETLMQEVNAALGRVLATDSPERVANGQAVGTIERAIADRGRESVVEQVAYTWFNRLCALRYMDARGYTPVGLVSPRPGETLPAVLADARRGIYAAGLDISQRNRDAINAVLNGDTTARDPLGRAYVMLLVNACKTYERSMDYLFGAGRDLAPAIELLAPTDLLSEGSLLQRICTGLDEATCNEGVEVMGWLYQFYVSERKDAFFASKKKATAADIAPATQLFTPNWIVRYLVENSLGRLWMLNYPDSELKDHMDYYVEPEEPEEDFLRIYSPEDITFLDPACGSGHILVYAFDLLYLMYEEEGYRPTDIPELILKNNLTGIEIDDRAAEIASFCLEMKALERDSDFLAKDCDANIVVTHRFDPNKDGSKLIPEICAEKELMESVTHFDQVGSLFAPSEKQVQLIRKANEAIADDGSMQAAKLRTDLQDLYVALSALATSYSVTVANPPYMGNGGMNTWLSSWIKERFPEEKGDLCTCFIERSFRFVAQSGYAALITMHSWMFLSAYEKMRKKIIDTRGIACLAHLGPHAFDAIAGEVVQTAATVYTGSPCESSSFIRLVDEGTSAKKQEKLLGILRADYPGLYHARVNDFKEIPGWPIAYWASDSMMQAFSRKTPLSSFIEARQGFTTGDNSRFLRLWFEISLSRTSFEIAGVNKWFPCDKGGYFRKWYGNNEYVADWENDGERLKAFPRSTVRNSQYYLREAFSWSDVSTDYLACRSKPEGFVFEHCSDSLFGAHEQLLLYGAFLNSSVARSFLRLLSPTMKFEVGQIRSLPIVFEKSINPVNNLSEECVEIAKEDWDSFETSWDFTWHPLVPPHYEWVDQHTYNMHASERQAGVERIETRFQRWERDCQSRFDQLKSNEEELNRIFAHIYDMEGEVPIEVPDDKVSVRLADLGRDIRGLVSYGVGCMFGRYSLDEPGLILADEDSTLDDYHAKVPNPTFEPNRTGIIPITDADTEWFEDDIVAQFRRWLAAAYGQGTLDENVAFIEHALGKSLRAYFVRDFYNDHLKTYQKRPIYWLFQSPKKGLSALVYLHRYNPNTVTTLLTEYIRPLREQMEAQARLLEVTGDARDASTATKYRATIDELDKWEHDVIFPLSQKHVALDLDDGVKANYGKPEFKGALRKVTGLN
jgi:hypothetical protein